MTISKPGKSQQELLNCLEKLKTKFSDEIEQYNIQITPKENGYKIYGERKVMLINFSVNVDIVARDGEFEMDYETNNVPKSKVKEAMEKIKDQISK